jgi:hypothetical protein
MQRGTTIGAAPFDYADTLAVVRGGTFFTAGEDTA